MIDLTLPFPPSVNTVWRRVGSRTLLSKRGREYRQEVASAVADQWQGEPLMGRVAVEIEVWPPDRRKRDIDNSLKAALDAITHAGVWGDDEQIDRILLSRGPVVSGGQCYVSIEELAQ